MSTIKNPADIVIENPASSTDDDVPALPSINPAEHVSRKIPKWRKIAGFFWDSVNGDPRDRRYIQKLDTFLL